MRCNDLGDQMRLKQPLKFGGQLGPQAKMSSQTQGPTTNAVLPAMENALKQGNHNGKMGKRLDLNG